MNIARRKFTIRHLRFRRAFKRAFERAWMLGVGSLLTIVLVNPTALDGRAGQAKYRAEPKAPQTSLNVTEISDRKIEGLAASGKSAVADYLGTRGARAPVARKIVGARVKVNLKSQRLTVIDAEGQTLRIIRISSGSGRWFTHQGRRRRAITPRGRFTVYRKVEGWRKSPLGLMYYPNYIVGGIAIHGSSSVPRRPASHGCVRIPMSDAKWFSDVTPIGTPVMVY